MRSNKPRPTDGRNIDPLLGTLAGEGSLQRIRQVDAPPHGEFGSAGKTPGDVDGPSYYGLPVLKEPVWKWYIPAYFYVGGVAGSCAALGAAAAAVDREDFADLARLCDVTAAAGAVVSGGLLIADLGRPGRFINMMRVFRPSSPMNLGTWILTAFGGAATAAAISHYLPMPRWTRGLLIAGAGATGVTLTGYTGVLLAGTAVPIWQGARRELPLLFSASGAAAGGAFLELFSLGKPAEKAVDRFATASKAAELVLTVVFERAVGRVPRVARPLRRGLSGWLFRGSQALTAVSLVLPLLSSRRAVRVTAGVLGTAAALALRFGIIQAGRASARDPHATFEQQRAG
jgi:formate-dependent nitrite reductase membrane component NrfD